MSDIAQWYGQIPLLTRYWFGASIVVPLLCRLNLFSPYKMILTPDFLKTMHLWKPITALLYYPLTGNRGFNFLVNLYFLYNYSQRLESGYFGGRQADYAFMLLFNWCCLVGLAIALGVMMLMDPMVMSVLYVYCMINQDQIVNFWFGTRFKARYLPWALFGVNFLLSGGGMSELLGILVGHLYYFVMMKYPADQGVTLLQTPRFMHYLFSGGSQGPPPTMFSSRNPPPRNTPTATTTTGYNWGRGRRLED